jgi:SAM-dependent methyltransferase
VSVQSETNRRVYSSRRILAGYVGRSLGRAERAVLEELGPAIRGKRVLELGSGAGALTRELLDAPCDVVGVDISPAMVEHCRATFPTATFLVGDLRDLSVHESASYAAVVAGANLIDVATHEERPGVLTELRRVLAPGGLLYFSTHNRNSTDALRQAHDGPTLRLGGGPDRLLRVVAGFALGTLNHRRLARHQVFEAEYAIINDSAHRWSLLHHYIPRDAEARELAACGFEVVTVRGTDGVVLKPSDSDAQFTELHYVARAV